MSAAALAPARRSARNPLALPGVPPLLALAAIAGAWQAASLHYGLDGLPSVPATLGALPELLRDRDTFVNLLDSLRRMAIGFALALAFGIPAGIVMGRSRLVARLFNPLLMVVYPVPKAALMPIIMLWLGIGDLSKTLVIVLGVSLPVIFHASAGARAVEEKMLWSAAAMGMGRWRRLVRVVLPAALPEILVGCRTGIVLALITMVTSEMIARQSGIGNVVFNALDLAQYETVYATILVIGALGVALDVVFERVRTALVGWAGTGPGIVAAGA